PLRRLSECIFPSPTPSFISLPLPFSPSFFQSSRAHPHLHSFPTRRSSDLAGSSRTLFLEGVRAFVEVVTPPALLLVVGAGHVAIDRKSTRLNSSHGSISYAVFCLKKKKNT